MGNEKIQVAQEQQGKGNEASKRIANNEPSLFVHWRKGMKGGFI